MGWVLLTLGSGVFNAFWTAMIQKRVREDGAVPFSAAMRWGVGLCLLPLAIPVWHDYSTRWWAASAASGLLESLGVWALARGVRKDYYGTYALSNVTPFFTAVFATWLLGEAMTLSLALGVSFVVAGAVWLYWSGHWSWWGIASAFVLTFSGLSSKWVIAESGFAPHACFSFLVGALAFTLVGAANGKVDARVLARNVWKNRWLILFSGIATVCFYSALILAPINRVSALVRVNMVVGFLLSVYMLKERKRLASRALGALLILAGLVLVAWVP
jgi:drug/metabolite transporter (DMT)-like permease